MYKGLSKQFIAISIAVALGVMSLAAVGERFLGSRIWLNDNTSFVEIVSSSLQKQQTLSFPDNFFRVWQIAPETDTITLHWKAKLLSGETNWDWQSHTQEDNLSIKKEGNKQYTHFTPKGPNPFIYKRFTQATSIANLSVNATLELRSNSEAENCGILSLAERGATLGKSINICTTKTWQSYNLEWQVPKETTKKDLTFVINRFNSPLDIGEFKLHIKSPNTTNWESVNALAPNGASIRLNWENAWLEPLLLEKRFLPSTEWQDYTLDIQTDNLNGAIELTGLFTGERGLNIAIKNTSISSNKNVQAIAGTNLRRLKLWFHHPNLMGHATVAITLAGLALSQAVTSHIIIIIFGVFLIILSGSRAAILTLSIGILLMLFFKQGNNTLRKRRITLITSLVFIPCILLLSFTQFDAFSRLAFGVGRIDIWSVAWQAIQQAPIFGIGFGNFPDFFENLRPNRAVVNHAHNLVFVYLSNYGLFGGLAIVWLLTSWVFLIIRGRIFRTASILLVPLGCIIFANIFDFSFFNAAVITALIAMIPYQSDIRPSD